MMIVRRTEVEGFEEVVRIEGNRITGWIAVHDTTLGPALGGCRVRRYADDREALADALRLAEAMTLKSALAGLPLGGGKMVVNLDPATIDDAVLDEIARAVDALGGRYIVAEDMGTSRAHMARIARRTRHVAWREGGGEPAPATAFGVLCAMDGWALWRHGRPFERLHGDRPPHVAIQGVGNVGARLARMLADRGVRLTVADMQAARAKEIAATFGATAVPPERIHRIEADVFAPCAAGGALDAVRCREIAAAAVIGSANNQLAAPGVLDILAERGIDYVPDFVANAGGVCHAFLETGRRQEVYEVAAIVERIAGRVHDILERAASAGRNTHEVAVEMALERVRRARPGGKARIEIGGEPR